MIREVPFSKIRCGNRYYSVHCPVHRRSHLLYHQHTELSHNGPKWCSLTRAERFHRCRNPDHGYNRAVQVRLPVHRYRGCSLRTLSTSSAMLINADITVCKQLFRSAEIGSIRFFHTICFVSINIGRTHYNTWEFSALFGLHDDREKICTTAGYKFMTNGIF